MSFETIPLSSYKANVELQLRLSRLLQESGHRWLDSVQQSSSESIAETTAQIEGLLRSENWQALATLPAETFWRLFQSRMSDAQTLNQIAVQNQAAFTTGLQQALESWQSAATQTLSTSGSTLPLQDIFKQWGALFTPPGSGAQGKSSKGK